MISKLYQVSELISQDISMRTVDLDIHVHAQGIHVDIFCNRIERYNQVLSKLTRNLNSPFSCCMSSGARSGAQGSRVATRREYIGNKSNLQQTHRQFYLQLFKTCKTASVVTIKAER